MQTPSSRTYKRNQIEQAIAAVAGRRDAAGNAPLELRNDLKRLLDIDRNPRAKQLDWDHPHFAFYDELSPGRGAEIAYSPYHAFALLIGQRLMESGLPQSTAVKFLREVRRELETAFNSIIATDPADLRPELTVLERQRLTADGVLVQEAGQMQFLVVEGALKGTPIHMPSSDDWDRTGNVCSSAKTLLERLVYCSHVRRAATVLELVNAAHQLVYWLERSLVRKRGPSS
jgi:hypothetical protein